MTKKRKIIILSLVFSLLSIAVSCTICLFACIKTVDKPESNILPPDMSIESSGTDTETKENPSYHSAEPKEDKDLLKTYSLTLIPEIYIDGTPNPRENKPPTTVLSFTIKTHESTITFPPSTKVPEIKASATVTGENGKKFAFPLRQVEKDVMGARNFIVLTYQQDGALTLSKGEKYSGTVKLQIENKYTYYHFIGIVH